MSSTFSSASFTAIEPTEILPLLIPVEFLTRVPTRIALSKSVFRCSPDVLAFLAKVIEFLIWPKICSSPITIESNPDVNFRR